MIHLKMLCQTKQFLVRQCVGSLRCCVLVIGLLYLMNTYDVIIVLASQEKNEGYGILTRWYERSLDGGQVSIRFAKVIGSEGSTNFKDINYYLERDAFLLAGNFMSREIDIIYIDFCGLWKMERDDNYYGTDGKSEH